MQTSLGYQMVRGDISEGHLTYAYPLDQRAAILWYHDHRMDFTGPSVWRGLAGFHLHHDDEEAALRLPASCRSAPTAACSRRPCDTTTWSWRPGEQARILIRFDGYPGKYVFHCHNLEHEDMAMMANFVTG